MEGNGNKEEKRTKMRLIFLFFVIGGGGKSGICVGGLTVKIMNLFFPQMPGVMLKHSWKFRVSHGSLIKWLGFIALFLLIFIR